MLAMLAVSVSGSSARTWDSDSTSPHSGKVQVADARQTIPPPSITSPSSGAVVAGKLSVTGTASRWAASVAVAIDGGAYTQASGTTKWSEPFDTTQLSNGAHTLDARATSSSGTTATSSI